MDESLRVLTRFRGCLHCLLLASASVAALSANAGAQQPLSPGKAKATPASAPHQAPEAPLLLAQPVPTPPAEAAERFSREGMRLGSYRLDAGIGVSEHYDDNIFATPTGRVSDFITTVSPFVTLRSAWQRHELNLDGSAAIGRYARNSGENFNDFSFGSDGRYDIDVLWNLFGGARFSRAHESRESPDAVAGTEPTRYTSTEAHAGTYRQFGSVTIRAGGTFERLNYRDVPAAAGNINNDDRDRNVYEAGARVGYLLGGGWEPFVQAAHNWRRYDRSVDDFGFVRRSHGYGVAAGIRFDLGALSGEMLAGYLRQSYSDARWSNTSAPDLGLQLNWQLAPGTRLSASLDRTIEETTLADSSGYLYTVIGLSMDHALARDLSLSLNASHGRADYQQVDRMDKLIGFGVGLRYFLLPHLYVGTEYRFLRRDSNAPGADYDDNQTFVRLGAQLARGTRDDVISRPGLPGLYLGIQALHGQVTTELDGPRGGGGNLLAEFGNPGTGLGGFAGYGASLARWYLGLEIEAEDSETGWAHQRLPGGRVFSVDKGPTVGAALRLGRWLSNGTLVYGRVGVARTQFETAYMTGSGRRFHQSDPRYGVRAGAGMELPLSERFFTRLDYTFTDYSDYDVGYTSGPDNFNNRETLARLGFGFRLQGPPADPDAGRTASTGFGGFYLGVLGGYGSLETLNTGTRQNDSVLVADRGGQGAAGGAFAGYGVAFGPAYFGAELDGILSGAGWKIQRDPEGRVYSLDRDASISASIRIGYILPRAAMVYGRVGASRTKLHVKYEHGANFVEQAEFRTGLRYGGGFEVPVGTGFFTRVDYTHASYGRSIIDYRSGVDSFETDEDQFFLGLGMRF